MTAPFAALEARINAAVKTHLANVTADFGGGVTADGMFKNEFAATLGFVAGSSPTLLVDVSDVPSVAQGSAVAIGAASYTVTGVEQDGTGMVLLRLQEV